MRSRSLGIALASLVPLASCAAPSASEPMAMRVTWASHDGESIPAGVSSLDIVTCVRRDGAEDCDTTTCSVAGISSASSPAEVCRPKDGTQSFGDEPVLVRDGLPTGVPVRFELRARNDAGELTHLGLAGPMILGRGERRFVELRMYEVGASRTVPRAEVQRFLHRATYLDDGRVLITGGFASSTPLEACPADLGLPAESRCFALVASREALAFDLGTGIVTAIRMPMLAARAGHSATSLPDGRVLIAGGATHGVLSLVPQGAGANEGYALAVHPRDAMDRPGALATFEVFDPFTGTDDPENDGDPARGRFLGAAGEASAGALNNPRFMHAATRDLADADRVLLIGGSGGQRSADSYEVYDHRRPGGYGVYRATGNRLTTARSLPGAAATNTGIWIFGGTLADDNTQLAEVWRPNANDPNGSSVSATALPSSAFPSSMPGVMQDHPEYSLLAPLVASVGGARALVVGWYGPQCSAGSPNPIFDRAGARSVFCNSPAGGAFRSFTVDADSGVAAVTQARPHAFGTVVELIGSDRIAAGGASRRLWAVAGGGANISWGAQSAIDVFTADVDANGAVQRTASEPTLDSARLMHAAAAIPSVGMVSVGGIAFTADVSQFFFVPNVEVVFLAR